MTRYINNHNILNINTRCDDISLHVPACIRSANKVRVHTVLRDARQDDRNKVFLSGTKAGYEVKIMGTINKMMEVTPTVAGRLQIIEGRVRQEQVKPHWDEDDRLSYLSSLPRSRFCTTSHPLEPSTPNTLQYTANDQLLAAKFISRPLIGRLYLVKLLFKATRLLPVVNVLRSL